MAESSSIPRPSLLWKKLSADRRQQAAEAFWQDSSALNEQAAAIDAIAQRLKFRHKTVAVLPAARKIQYLLGLPAVPEAVAARLLMSYHIQYQRPLMAAFLDALGIAHDNGMIGEEIAVSPEPDKVRAAASEIAASFPAEDVALYLSTLSWQDPETWAVLAELRETRL
jgi:hypothetical protein